jgi:uncharacterized protein YukE
MNFDSLTDEEIDVLKDAIEARIQARQAPGGDDQAGEDAKFSAIAETLEAMQAKIKAMDEEIDTLVDLVQHEIIDKIEEGVEANRRTTGIKGLGEKYGERFEPFRDFYKEMTGGADILERLWDELEEAKKAKEGWGDEDEAGKIEELVKGLAERRDGIKGALGEKPSEGEGKAVAVKQVIAAPVEGPEDLVEVVKKMKQTRIPGMPK